MKRVEKTWTQKDGTKVAIKDMSVRHLKNTIALLKRKGFDKAQKIWMPVEYLAWDSGFSGESEAAYQYEQFVDEAFRDGGYYTSRPKHPTYDALVNELDSRKKVEHAKKKSK